MAEDNVQPDDETGADDGAEGGSKKPKKTPGKKLVFRVVLPVAVLAALGAGAYFGGVVDMVTGGGQANSADGVAVEAEPEEPKDLVYYDLPEMLVNLSSDGRRTHFLKIKVSLELSNRSDIERVEAILPRIVDNFQVYLRELRIEDLQGSAGLYRLREELLTRVTLAVAPAEVSDVLFREMIVQ